MIGVLEQCNQQSEVQTEVGTLISPIVVALPKNPMNIDSTQVLKHILLCFTMDFPLRYNGLKKNKKPGTGTKTPTYSASNIMTW